MTKNHATLVQSNTTFINNRKKQTHPDAIDFFRGRFFTQNPCVFFCFFGSQVSDPPHVELSDPNKLRKTQLNLGLAWYAVPKKHIETQLHCLGREMTSSNK